MFWLTVQRIQFILGWLQGRASMGAEHGGGKLLSPWHPGSREMRGPAPCNPPLARPHPLTAHTATSSSVFQKSCCWTQDFGTLITLLICLSHYTIGFICSSSLDSTPTNSVPSTECHLPQGPGLSPSHSSNDTVWVTR